MNLPNREIVTDATLVIFCKRPRLNQGKQRLANEIGAKAALSIANSLLECAIEDAKNWQGPVVLACSNHEDMVWANSLNIDAQIIEQLPHGQSGNLGQRLNYVDQTLRQLGHTQLVFIGTDAPMLTHEHYQEILLVLGSNDIALSHAQDGGVVIMANKVPWPFISHLPWSTNKLSFALLEACRESLLSTTYGLPGYDIDYLEDIKKLLTDLPKDCRPARQALLQNLIDLSLFSKASQYA